MKKIVTIFALTFCLTAPKVKAQIPNAGFENVNTDGSTSNWGNVYIFTLGDSIIWDNYFYFPTSDSHSGSKAIELHNAWNYTANKGMAGSISSDTDSIYSAWGSFELVPIAYSPTDLSFYYKYFPLNGDSAVARLGVFDSLGNQVGEAVSILSGTTSTYTLMSVPVVYNANDPVAYYSLNFSTFFTEAPGVRQPSLGTRLLIDDVNLGSSTGIIEKESKDTWFVFPNPAKDVIGINLNSKLVFSIEIRDMIGKTVLKTENKNNIDVSRLAKGVYIIRKFQDGEWVTKKFVKE